MTNLSPDLTDIHNWVSTTAQNNKVFATLKSLPPSEADQSHTPPVKGNDASEPGTTVEPLADAPKLQLDTLSSSTVNLASLSLGHDE